MSTAKVILYEDRLCLTHWCGHACNNVPGADQVES